MEQLQKGVLATDSKDVQHLSVYNTYKETHTHNTQVHQIHNYMNTSVHIYLFIYIIYMY